MANRPANVLSGQPRSAVSSLFLSHTVVCALPSPVVRHIGVRERNVGLVRTLPSRWLESYTVTADTYLPYLFPLFSLSPAMHSHIFRVFELTSLQFSPLQRLAS